MKINSDQWVLEWSARQNAFHIQTLSETLSTNRRWYSENLTTTNDYRILLVASKDECHLAADNARRTLQERESAQKDGKPA